MEPAEDELILKRSFSLGGSTRQFVNGSPTTLAVLKTIGDELVDLHGPHDHQSLLSPERQLDLLDCFAHAETVLADYRRAFARCKRWSPRKQALSTAESAREQELDFLRHQVQRNQRGGLQPNEEEETQARYQLASNSRRLDRARHYNLASPFRERMTPCWTSSPKRSGSCASWKRSTRPDGKRRGACRRRDRTEPKSRAPLIVMPSGSISIQSSSHNSSNGSRCSKR